MRYVGQGHALSIPVGAGSLADGGLTEALAAFHREHARTYNFSAPAEVVDVCVTVVGWMPRPTPRLLEDVRERATALAEALKQHRQVFYGERAGFMACAIYDRHKLGAGLTSSGPAIVEELDSTTVIHPGYRATVDPFGNLLISPR